MSQTWIRFEPARSWPAYGLDPYSTYLTPEQVREYNGGNKDNQAGIGAELSQVASYLYVIAPMKGSPADQAGIQSRGHYRIYRQQSHSRHFALRRETDFSMALLAPK